MVTMKTDLEHGDRLISLTHEYSNPASPTGLDETTYLAEMNVTTTSRAVCVNRISMIGMMVSMP